jgi:pyruvate-formate lyase
LANGGRLLATLQQTADQCVKCKSDASNLFWPESISTTPSGTAKSGEPFIKGMSTAKGQDLATPMKNLTFELKNSRD